MSYLYLGYWIVGLDEEEFYIPKANYCADIGWYNMAIRAYKKALKDSTDPRIHSALGWCYAEVRMDEKAVEQYRIAFAKKKCPEMAIGLAYAEYSVGNIIEFQKVYEYLDNYEINFSAEYQDEFIKLRKIRENLLKTNVSIDLNQMKA